LKRLEYKADRMSTFFILSGILGLGVLGFWHRMRLWTVTVIGFNLLFATLFSIGLFETVANKLDGALSMMAYYNDMLVFLFLFAIILTILMLVTIKISKIDLYFSEKTDKIAKWIVCIVVVLGFCGTGVFVFFETMPEKPRTDNVLPSMKVVDFISKGSLKPLIGSTTWDTADFVQRQYKRNAGVYEGTMENGSSTGWKFDGDSPNAQ